MKWSIAAMVLLLLGVLAVLNIPPWVERQPVPSPEATGTVIDGGKGYTNEFFGLGFAISNGGRIFSREGTNALIDKGVKDFKLGKAILQNNVPSNVSAGIYPDTGQMVFIGCSKYAYPGLTEEQCLLNAVKGMGNQKEMTCTIVDTELTAQIGGLDFLGFSYTLHSDTLDTRYQEEYLYMKDGSLLTIMVWGEGYTPDESFIAGRERIFGDFAAME